MGCNFAPHFHYLLVRPERFELPALWFVARCSIQLSYGRILKKIQAPDGGRKT